MHSVLAIAALGIMLVLGALVIIVLSEYHQRRDAAPPWM